MKRFGNKLTVLAVCTAALTACGGRQQEQQVAREYPVMTVATSDITLETTYSATIQGRQDVSVYPQVSGTITQVMVTEGQNVRKGQVLFIIDQVPYQSAYESAKANYEAAQVSVESAQLNYDSDLKLYENKVISSFQLQQTLNSLNTAKATLAQTEAQLVQAANNLSYTEVKSPVDGVMGTIPYRVGALVSSAMSQPLTTVSDNSVMYVYFSIGEAEALDLAFEYGSLEKAIEQMPEVSLKLSNGALYPISGRVASISRVINTSTGSVQVRAEFPNPDRILLSGSNGSVIFPDAHKDAVVVPQEATFQLQDKIFVYKVVDGVTKSSMIEVEPKDDGKNYIVVSGLEVGEKIIAKGAGLMRDGMPVGGQN